MVYEDRVVYVYEYKVSVYKFHYRHSSAITNKALKLKYTKTNFTQS